MFTRQAFCEARLFRTERAANIRVVVSRQYLRHEAFDSLLHYSS